MLVLRDFKNLELRRPLNDDQLFDLTGKQRAKSQQKALNQMRIKLNPGFSMAAPPQIQRFAAKVLFPKLATSSCRVLFCKG